MSQPSDVLDPIRSNLLRAYPKTPYRIIVIHRGRLRAEWSNLVDISERLKVASVVKSLYASILGIALDDGTIRSIDDAVVDYAPWMMDVGPSEGPKEERYATTKDRDTTFRHILTHSSGYLKLDQSPGEGFHYQTFAMNLLAHTLANAYGRYDPYADDESARPGIGSLIEEWIRNPIGAHWEWKYGNFPDLSGQAKVNIFGNNTHIYASARDLGRLGWLWACDGNWFGTQVLPPGWIDACTQPLGGLQGTCPEDAWPYGQGFWINHDRRLWPELPAHSYAAWGRGGHSVWISPADNLVIATCPRPIDQDEEDSARSMGRGIVPRIVEALTY